MTEEQKKRSQAEYHALGSVRWDEELLALDCTVVTNETKLIRKHVMTLWK
jgi:hypothetical protein